MSSLSKMIRIAGRDKDGKARAIATNERGEILTQLTGSNVGYSDETKPTGEKGETFLELDTLDVYIHDGSEWVKIT